MKTEPLDLVKNLDGEYKLGLPSANMKSAVVNAFHKEVVNQLLLGNRVILPRGIAMDIIRHESKKSTVISRLGFEYKVRMSFPKMKEKRVKFTPAITLAKRLNKVLSQTNFEYKIVDHGYK